MKRWILVILLLLSVGLNVGLLAQRGREKAERPRRAEARQEAGDSAERRERRERARERLLENMVDKVGVAGERRERFVEIHRGFFERTREQREQQRRAERALRENLASAAPDRALAEVQLAEIAAAKKEIEAAFVENFFEASALLDPDQQARYRELVAELRRFRWQGGRRGRDRAEENGRRERRERREAEEAPPAPTEGN